MLLHPPGTCLSALIHYSEGAAVALQTCQRLMLGFSLPLPLPSLFYSSKLVLHMAVKILMSFCHLGRKKKTNKKLSPYSCQQTLHDLALCRHCSLPVPKWQEAMLPVLLVNLPMGGSSLPQSLSDLCLEYISLLVLLFFFFLHAKGSRCLGFCSSVPLCRAATSLGLKFKNMTTLLLCFTP